MSEHIYKQVELTVLPKSVEKTTSLQTAIAKAAKTLHNIHWFQVVEKNRPAHNREQHNQC